MPIALSAAAMIPAAGEIGAAFEPVGLAIAAVTIVGCIAYEAGFFDWLGDVLEDGWNWLKNGFGKVVQKAKSVVQEDIIPGVLEGIDWVCKAVGVKGKGKTGKAKTEKGKSFRGGSKKSRDKWYGKNDKEFQKWWERQGKKSYGEDIQDPKMADDVYREWIDLGKPKGR